MPAPSAAHHRSSRRGGVPDARGADDAGASARRELPTITQTSTAATGSHAIPPSTRPWSHQSWMTAERLAGPRRSRHQRPACSSPAPPWPRRVEHAGTRPCGSRSLLQRPQLSGQTRPDARPRPGERRSRRSTSAAPRPNPMRAPAVRREPSAISRPSTAATAAPADPAQREPAGDDADAARRASTAARCRRSRARATPRTRAACPRGAGAPRTRWARCTSPRAPRARGTRVRARPMRDRVPISSATARPRRAGRASARGRRG